MIQSISAWYHVYGILLIALSILPAIWLIFHVEKSPQLSWPKVALAILLTALSSGFGLHLLLLAFGV